VAPIVAWRASALLHGIEACPTPDYLDAAAGEVREASLTRQGISLDGEVYHDQRTVTRLMERLAPVDPMKSKRRTSQRARVKIKHNPADQAVIHVWNHRDEEYVPLPALRANFLKGLTKTQAWIIEKLAKINGLPFDTDAECCKARLALIRKLEDAKPQWLKDQEKKHQRILLADRPGLVSGNILRVLEAPARHDGMAPVIDETGVHVPIDAGRRAGGGAPVKSARRGGKAATRKATATRRASKALTSALAAEEAATRDVGPVKAPDPATVVIPRPGPPAAIQSAGNDVAPPTAGGSRRAAIMARLVDQGWGEGSKGSNGEDGDGR
jgi:putative transposase